MKYFDGPMKLNQLKLLAAVVDTGSFSAAAARLDCTQSRVSHAIGELERELGVRLLMRARNGSVPTEVGVKVLEKARGMLRLEDSMLELTRDGRELAGVVRIACFRSVGTHLLPHVLQALADDYPGIRIDIADGCDERNDVTDALQLGRADIGIAQLPVAGDLVWQSYVSDSYRLVVPASCSARDGGGWPVLGDLPFIELACSGAAAILERCRDTGFNPKTSRLLSNDTSIVAMVGRGMGYSILPELSVFPKSEEVRTLALPIPARREFVVAGMPGPMRSPVVRAVVRCLRDKRIVARTRAYQAGIVA
jgi:DNA-binding transcriptional LysR family regulator